MDKSNDLINQAVSEVAASRTRSPIEVGQTEKEKIAGQDAINQVFTLFRINYHNQYFAAYGQNGSLESEGYARRLWFESLKHFTPEQLLLAAKQIIVESDYLPTLHKMIETCENNLQSLGLPNFRDAYLEACRAPSPKAAYSWSHPAVYHAGLETGWRLLASTPESESYPVFAEKYRQVIRRVTAGEKLEIEKPKAISRDPGKPLNKETKQQKIRELKKLLQ